MNNFEFCNPVKVVFGKGSIARLSALLPEGSKVLVVYGGGSIKKNGKGRGPQYQANEGV